MHSCSPKRNLPPSPVTPALHVQAPVAPPHSRLQAHPGQGAGAPARQHGACVDEERNGGARGGGHGGGARPAAGGARSAARQRPVRACRRHPHQQRPRTQTRSRPASCGAAALRRALPVDVPAPLAWPPLQEGIRRFPYFWKMHIMLGQLEERLGGAATQGGSAFAVCHVPSAARLPRQQEPGGTLTQLEGPILPPTHTHIHTPFPHPAPAGNTDAARLAYAAGIKRCMDAIPLWVAAARLEERAGNVAKARALLEQVGRPLRPARSGQPNSTVGSPPWQPLALQPWGHAICVHNKACTPHMSIHGGARRTPAGAAEEPQDSAPVAGRRADGAAGAERQGGGCPHGQGAAGGGLDGVPCWAGGAQLIQHLWMSSSTAPCLVRSPQPARRSPLASPLALAWHACSAASAGPAWAGLALASRRACTGLSNPSLPHWARPWGIPRPPAKPAPCLQDCPDSGVLWAESINMAPRPQRKSRSGGLPMLLQASRRQRGPVRPHGARQPGMSPRFTACQAMGQPSIACATAHSRHASLPAAPAPAVDALKKCNDDPHVVAAVAGLFWADRKVDKARSWFNRAVTLNPGAPPLPGVLGPRVGLAGARACRAGGLVARRRELRRTAGQSCGRARQAGPRAAPPPPPPPRACRRGRLLGGLLQVREPVWRRGAARGGDEALPGGGAALRRALAARGQGCGQRAPEAGGAAQKGGGRPGQGAVRGGPGAAAHTPAAAKRPGRAFPLQALLSLLCTDTRPLRGLPLLSLLVLLPSIPAMPPLLPAAFAWCLLVCLLSSADLLTVVSDLTALIHSATG